MVKRLDVCKRKTNLIKTLKKVKEKLECSPPCQIKPLPCNTGTYYNCFLLKNVKNTRSCTPNGYVPFSSDVLNSYENPCKLKNYSSQNICYCQNFSPLCCMSARLYQQSYSRSTPFCCDQIPRRCFKETCSDFPTGFLCLRCNTIYLPKVGSDTTSSTKNNKMLSCSKSIELRGGEILKGCDCNKKNGLQDRCLRYCCINNPKCKNDPISCRCNKHLNEKKNDNSYTCYTYGMPMQLVPSFYCCNCSNSQVKCENACQCRPVTQEVGCFCECPAEQTYSAKPKTWSTSHPCYGINSNSPIFYDYSVKNICDCNDESRDDDNNSCVIICSQRCRSCQTPS